VKIPVDDIKTSPTELHFTEEVEELNRLLSQDGQAGYRFTHPLQISTVHLRSGDELLLSGTIRGELIGQCARCVEDYPLTLAREFSVILKPQRTLDRDLELNHEELEASFYSGEMIDLSALVREQTLLALPSQPLCREDCHGLCAQCGVNLNLESCTCQPAWRDPRLAVLSTLRLPSSRADK
jgi:uncharacterized protein